MSNAQFLDEMTVLALLRVSSEAVTPLGADSIRDISRFIENCDPDDLVEEFAEERQRVNAGGAATTHREPFDPQYKRR